jgi:AcrR family transcriptional regulator
MANGQPQSVRKRAAPSRTDRRTLRTRRALGTALVDLMVARSFDDISVQQVLDRARVGRATFYAHFRNKHDLLLSDVERFCELLLDAHFLAHARGGQRVAPVAELFAHVAEYRAFERALARSGLQDVVLDLVAGHLARVIARRIAELRPDHSAVTLPPAVTARMLAASLVEMLRWWLDQPARPTAREMDAHFHDMVWTGLGGAPT